VKRRQTYKPKFDVGDRAIVAYVPHGSDFYHEDDVRVVERRVRLRSEDPGNTNRYRVVTTARYGRQVEGWLYEADLEAYDA
jgi:hypothetical protein